MAARVCCVFGALAMACTFDMPVGPEFTAGPGEDDLEDAGAGVIEDGTRQEHGPKGGVDSFQGGPLVYDAIDNGVVLGDLVDVEWHPSGRFALLLAENGTVARWVPGAPAVTHEHILELSRGARIAASPSGAYFLIVGNDGPATELWRATVGESDRLTFTEEPGALTGTAATVRAEPGTDRFAIATRLDPYRNALYTWTVSSGLSAARDYASLAGAGASDVAWMSHDQILVSEGGQGGGSSTWDLSNGRVKDRVGVRECGNLGTIVWRPGGTFGLAVALSSSRICVFDGAWTATELTDGPSDTHFESVHFHPSGRRALAVGRAWGLPLMGSAFEYRAPVDSPYDGAGWVDVSIPDFDMTPYVANRQTQLRSVKWRPGSDCDEGLIVGSDTGRSFDPNAALAIRFYDSTDPDCS